MYNELVFYLSGHSEVKNKLCFSSRLKEFSNVDSTLWFTEELLLLWIEWRTSSLVGKTFLADELGFSE